MVRSQRLDAAVEGWEDGRSRRLDSWTGLEVWKGAVAAEFLPMLFNKL